MAKKKLGHNESDKLDKIISLLQYSLAVELSAYGVPQAEIGKRLGIATASVNKWLKGVTKKKE